MFTKSPKTLCVLLLVGLSACGVSEGDSSGGSDGSSDPSLRFLSSKVIMGALDWKSTTSLPASSLERARSKAVGILEYDFRIEDNQPVHSRCTAWLASKDVVITNGHCIGGPDKVKDARVSFNYEDGAGSPVWYDCVTFIRSWGNGQSGDHNDTSALRCNPRNGTYPGETYGYLKVSPTNVAQNDSIYVIHQNCERPEGGKCSADPTKKYSPGKVLDIGDDSRYLTHDADTLGGSSGAPMLSQSSHEVVGMNRGDAGSANAKVNTAVRGRLLREFIKELKDRQEL